MNLQRAFSRVDKPAAAKFARSSSMSRESELEEDKIWNGLYPRISFLIRQNKWKWESLAASFGLGGGILSLIAGIICDVSARCLTSGNSSALLKKASIVSFFLCLPLMILGSHFLDVLETKYFSE